MSLIFDGMNIACHSPKVQKRPLEARGKAAFSALFGGGLRMVRVELRETEQSARSSHDEWSHRRSAFLVLMAGAIFWVIVGLILLRAHLF